MHNAPQIMIRAGVLLSVIAFFPEAKAEASAFVSLQDHYLNDRILQLKVAANMPVMRKPYAVAEVRHYLNQIKNRLPGLYQEIDQHLHRYEQNLALTRAELTAANGKTTEHRALIGNGRGELLESSYRGSAQAIWRPADALLLSLGATARAQPNQTLPVDSYLVFGNENIQLDLGFREHWLSPFNDGAMLYSSNARPSFSIGLSNPIAYENWWNLHYEVFVTRLERMENIAYGDSVQSGRPAVLGSHLSFMPLPGWTLSLTRTMQFGGGGREISVKSIWNAFIDPVSNDNDFGDLCEGQNASCETGNQQAALSSQMQFGGDTPFMLYFEYAGEDAKTASNVRLGNLSASYGLYVPFLPAVPDWSLRYEHQQWQDAWYVHHIYFDGYSNDGVVLGHWGANERVYGDDVGASARSLTIGRQIDQHERIEWQFRSLKNEDYGVTDYADAKDFSLLYYGRFWQQNYSFKLSSGENVFGEKLRRIELSWTW